MAATGMPVRHPMIARPAYWAGFISVPPLQRVLLEQSGRNGGFVVGVLKLNARAMAGFPVGCLDVGDRPDSIDVFYGPRLHCFENIAVYIPIFRQPWNPQCGVNPQQYPSVSKGFTYLRINRGCLDFPCVMTIYVLFSNQCELVVLGGDFTLLLDLLVGEVCAQKVISPV